MSLNETTASVTLTVCCDATLTRIRELVDAMGLQDDGNGGYEPVPSPPDTAAEAANVTLSKTTEGSANRVIGDVITSNVTITTDGAIDDLGVVDLVPDNPSGTTRTWTRTTSAGTVSGAASGTGDITQTISVSEAATVTYVIEDTIGANGSYRNSASVVGGNITNAPVVAVSGISVTVAGVAPPAANVTIAKTTQGSAQRTVGDVLTSTVIVTTGGAVNGVLISDPVPTTPAGTTRSWTRATTGATVTGDTNATGTGAISQTVNTAGAATITYTIEDTVTAAGEYTNSSSVTGANITNAPVPASSGDTVVVSVETLHISNDLARLDNAGTGTAADPFNAVNVDRLRSIINDDTKIPPGSTVLLGPGNYEVSGIGTLGVQINKSLILEGPKSARVFLSANRIGPAGGAAANAFAYMVFGLGRQAPFSNSPYDVTLRGFTIDANFQNRVESNATGDDNISQGGVVSNCRNTLLEDLDIVNCGELEKDGESFWVITDNQIAGSDAMNAVYRGVRVYDEVITDGELQPPAGYLGATALHIGGGQTNGRVNGLMENCSVDKSYRGVSFGFSTSDVMVIRGCSNSVATPESRTTAILHDTGPALAVTIENNNLRSGRFDYSILSTAASDTIDISNNKFVRDQRQAQAAFRFNGNNAVTTFESNTVSGTGTSQVLMINSTTTETIHVNNTVVAVGAGVASLTNTGNPVTSASGNFFDDGTPIPLTN